jgi:hypothetical protein
VLGVCFHDWTISKISPIHLCHPSYPDARISDLVAVVYLRRLGWLRAQLRQGGSLVNNLATFLGCFFNSLHSALFITVAKHVNVPVARRVYGCVGMTPDAWKFLRLSCEDSQARFVTLPEMGKVERDPSRSGGALIAASIAPP